MLNQSQQEKVAKRCTVVLVKAVDAFPELLAACERESAAHIVADLIKTQLQQPTIEPAEKSLEEILMAAALATD